MRDRDGRRALRLGSRSLRKVLADKHYVKDQYHAVVRNGWKAQRFTRVNQPDDEGRVGHRTQEHPEEEHVEPNGPHGVRIALQRGAARYISGGRKMRRLFFFLLCRTEMTPGPRGRCALGWSAFAL